MKRIKAIANKIWRNSWLFLLAGATFFVLAAAMNQTSSVKCRSVSISIDHESGNFFVEQEHVQHIIQREFGDSLPGHCLDSMNFRTIEANMEQNPYVASANIHAGIKGDVTITVQQRQPIVRVIGHGRGNYYLDRKGKKMPLSDNYTARVPVATVAKASTKDSPLNRDSVINEGLYRIASYVYDRKFWKAQIGQIVITEELNYKLVPRLGPHDIAFGKPQNIDRKFDKLMTFYREGLKRVGWGKYDKVSLQYEDQIVAKK
jgi:cell division protein FtsQ